MTKYFFDTEFAENGEVINLISIGIVAEDGREYYGQSVDVDISEVNNWVREHVIPQLTLCPHETSSRIKHIFSGRCSPECPWRTREQLRDDVLAFVNAGEGTPEFWAWYAAYDHVALAQLFGRMIDLPKGWPMLTYDIKQWADMIGNPTIPKQEEGEHNALADARWNKFAYDFLVGYSLPIRRREP